MTFSWNGIILQVNNVTEKEENAGKSAAGIFLDGFVLMLYITVNNFSVLPG